MTTAQVTPRLEIDLSKIQHNSRQLSQQLAPQGITITGVTKATLGDHRVASAMLSGGISTLGDSRIENIRKMRDAGVRASFMLLRSPQLSRIDEVVQYADISLNSEPAVLERLSESACRQGLEHRVLLMVELGDLREGIRLDEIETVVAHCQQLPNLIIEGIGTNLTCLSGVVPDDHNMGQLSELAAALQDRFGLKLAMVSGGNSSSLDWLANTACTGNISNVRLGEALLLGCETLHGLPLAGLYQGAISLVAEVIESRRKPSVPQGTLARNAFGEQADFIQRGEMHRCILDMGQQDIKLGGLKPVNPALTILGASSDHLVLDATRQPLAVGAEVRFQLDYSALLAAMTSPFVTKCYC